MLFFQSLFPNTGRKTTFMDSSSWTQLTPMWSWGAQSFPQIFRSQMRWWGCSWKREAKGDGGMEEEWFDVATIFTLGSFCKIKESQFITDLCNVFSKSMSSFSFLKRKAISSSTTRRGWMEYQLQNIMVNLCMWLLDSVCST